MRIGPYRVDVVDVQLELLEDMLGTAPLDPEVYDGVVAPKARELGVREGLLREEVGTLPEDPDQQKPGFTGFHRDSLGVFLFDYQVRGCLKELANKMRHVFGVASMRDKVESYVYVAPRRIYVKDRYGHPIQEPSGVLKRPLRAMTMQGPRSTVVVSEVVPAGSRLDFELHIFEHTRSRSDKTEITPDVVLWLLKAGEFHGLGQWRTGGWGRFRVTRYAIREADARWPGKEFRAGQNLLEEMQDTEVAVAAAK